jgi:hypothetical protein
MDEYLAGAENNLKNLQVLLTAKDVVISVESSAQVLDKFQVMDQVKDKIPDKWTVSVALLGGASIDLRSFTKILPIEVLDKFRERANSFMNAHRSKHQTSLSTANLKYTFMKVAYTKQCLETMEVWHKISRNTRAVQAATRWVKSFVQQTFKPDDAFRDFGRGEDADSPIELVVDKLNKIDLRDHPRFSLVSFVGTALLDDVCMQSGLETIHKITDATVVPVYASAAPLGEEGAAVLRDTKVFDDFTRAAYVVAINLPEAGHWCGAIIDASKDKISVLVFEPMQAHVAHLKQRVAALIAPFKGQRDVSIRPHTEFGQVENYNCGVFVLMAIELHLRNIAPSNYDSEEAAAYFRFRYLAHALNV